MVWGQSLVIPSSVTLWDCDGFSILPMSPGRGLVAHNRRYSVVLDEHCLPCPWDILIIVGAKGFQKNKLQGI